MSSNEDNDSAPPRKRGHRPCDTCRRKKRRCDGRNPCGHCIQHDFNCTYQQRAIQRTSAVTSYVQWLENRLQSVESQLGESNVAVSSPGHSSPVGNPSRSPILDTVIRSIRELNNLVPTRHSDDPSFTEVADTLQSLSLNNPGHRGFQGRSSQAMLVKAAVELKTDSVKSDSENFNAPRPLFPAKPWTIRPGQDPPPRGTYTFPEYDLMISLVSLYFDNVNVFFPILHRPTYTKAVATDTHIRDDGFAGTLLLVCALGSCYSDDPRLHLPAATTCATAGWKWFDQVRLAGQPLYGQVNLYDLQCYCLAVQFLDRTSGPRACWTLVGFGIRLAVDIGAHRSKAHTGRITLEEELEKRAYWTLLFFDAQFSGSLGRAVAAPMYDFDLDPPLRSEDEYWESTGLSSSSLQPLDTPSTLDFFICLVKMNRIFAYTQKVLYSTHNNRRLLGLEGDGWEKELVIELDSALNMWLDSVPVHLRWDPACPSDVFLDQSATLYCSYYVLQIFIHRPFIPAMRRSGNPTSFPSLTICNNAARACITVAETQQRRRPNNPLLFGQTAMFTAAIVLLLNIWGSNRTGRARGAELADVHRCMHVLRAYKERWPSAEPLLDTLDQLLKVDHVPTVRESRPEPVYNPSPFVIVPESGALAQPVGSGNTSSASPSTHDSSPEDGLWGTFTGGEWENCMAIASGAGEAPAQAPRLLNTIPLGNAQIPYFGGTPVNGNGTGNAFDTDMYTETAAIWSTVPTGFEASDWDMYLGNIGDMVQVEYHAST
ncbi:fungal-specific transcription factor domain-containing protein [Mycena galericulata]|nr:fungal-specific transcription factor domain-containing protein [Mycena galericulata]